MATAQDASTEYPMGDISRWLPQVKTFHLQAEVRDESTPEDIAISRLEFAKQFPDIKNPDPLDFNELLPVKYTLVDSAYDPTRLCERWESRTENDVKLSRSAYLWDGKIWLSHSQYFRSKQNGFGLSPKADEVGQIFLLYVTYLHKQPPVFWWNHTPENKKNYEMYRGGPTDFVPVGRDLYHGVDCYVFLETKGNQSNRYYIGVKDGRWYGAKQGIIAVPDEDAMLHNYELALQEFYGKKINVQKSEAASTEIRKQLDTPSLEKEKLIGFA